MGTSGCICAKDDKRKRTGSYHTPTEDHKFEIQYTTITRVENLNKETSQKHLEVTY